MQAVVIGNFDGVHVGHAHLFRIAREAVFGDAFTFDPDRAKNQQIAFGFGAHVCLGQHLARMEMRIMMEELLPRLKKLELAGEPARVESVFVGGLKRLPIRFEAA